MVSGIIFLIGLFILGFYHNQKNKSINIASKPTSESYILAELVGELIKHDTGLNVNITHGVALDIIPIDGYPDSKFERKKQCFWALIYSIYCAQLVPENHGKIVTLLGKIALGIVPSRKLRYRIWRFAEKQMTKYPITRCKGITELCSGPGYMKNWYPRKAFDKAIFKPFEDLEMPIPVGYDAYLNIAFGDYMEMPPVEKRVGHHDALFMDLDNSCKKYKGIYYCR